MYMLCVCMYICSVVGGRVMTNSNKQYHVKNETSDVDACN